MSRNFVIKLIVLMFFLIFCSLFFKTINSRSVSIHTDKDSYAPRSTVHIEAVTDHLRGYASKVYFTILDPNKKTIVRQKMVSPRIEKEFKEEGVYNYSFPLSKEATPGVYKIVAIWKVRYEKTVESSAVFKVVSEN